MVKRIIDNFYTEEDNRRLEEIQQEIFDILLRNADADIEELTGGQFVDGEFIHIEIPENEMDYTFLEVLQRERDEIHEIALAFYMSSLGEGEELEANLLRDIRETVDALEKADFTEHLEEVKQANKREIAELREQWQRGELPPSSDALNDWIDDVLKHEADTPDNAADFILGTLWAQTQIWNSAEPELPLEPIGEIIKGKLEEWYPSKGEAAGGEDPATVRANIKHTDKALYPVDKVNGHIWRLLEKAENGQIAIDFATEKRGSAKEATVTYAIDFSELDGITLTKELTAYDKRVYVSAAALFNSGNDVISATQIYANMGYKGRAGDVDLDKIDESLTKMSGARILLDNSIEHDTYKKYPLFKYDGSLLPMERVRAYINGKLTESAIHLFREPPMITFARDRKQVTTIPILLLESPVSKTDKNLKIDDYLIERIARMQDGNKVPRKILYKTLFDNCDISKSRDKERAKKTISKYLTHYRDAAGWIKGFEEQPDGVKITL